MSYDVFQYIVLGLLVVGACYSIYRIFRKNFTKSKGGGCDKGCGCS